MTLKKRLIKGGILVGLSSVIVVLFTYLFRLIMVRYLTIEDFGLYYALLPIFLVTNGFLDFGLSALILKYGSEFLASKKNGLFRKLIISYYKIKFILGIVIFCVFVLLSSTVMTKYVDSPNNIYLFIAMGLFYSLYGCLFNIILILFRIFENQTWYSIYEVCRTIGLFLLTILFFELGYNLWSPIMAYFITSILLSVVFYTLTYNKYWVNFKDVKSVSLRAYTNKFVSFASYNVFFILGSYILGYTDTIMLTYYTNLKLVGYYNVALPTAKLLLFFISAFTLILVPLISKQLVQKQNVLTNKLMNMVYKLYLLLIMPVAVIIFLFSDSIILFLFGQEYLPASNSLRLLGVAMLFNSLFTINSNVFNGVGRPRMNFHIILIGSTINVLVNWLLIPSYGATGAALASLLSYFCMMVVSFWCLKEVIKVDYMVISKVFFCNLLFAGILLFLDNIILLDAILIRYVLSLSVAITLYLLSLFILGIINIKNLKSLMQEYL